MIKKILLVTGIICSQNAYAVDGELPSKPVVRTPFVAARMGENENFNATVRDSNPTTWNALLTALNAPSTFAYDEPNLVNLIISTLQSIEQSLLDSATNPTPTLRLRILNSQLAFLSGHWYGSDFENVWLEQKGVNSVCPSRFPIVYQFLLSRSQLPITARSTRNNILGRISEFFR